MSWITCPKQQLSAGTILHQQGWTSPPSAYSTLRYSYIRIPTTFPIARLHLARSPFSRPDGIRARETSSTVPLSPPGIDAAPTSHLPPCLSHSRPKASRSASSSSSSAVLPTKSASTAAVRIPPGRRCPLASTYVSTVPPTTVIWASTFRLCAPRISINGSGSSCDA